MEVGTWKHSSARYSEMHPVEVPSTSALLKLRCYGQWEEKGQVYE